MRKLRFFLIYLIFLTLISGCKTIKQKTDAIVEKENQRVKTIDRYEKKILRSIQWIEKKIEEFNSEELTMDQIAVACALDYTSFRFSDKWGMNNPKLYKWMKEFSENQYLQETKPGVSFKYE